MNLKDLRARLQAIDEGVAIEKVLKSVVWI